VYADPIQLQQVVLNLVRNAIDAMVDAPKTARGPADDPRAAEGEVEVTVADHGTGLAPEATEHLFNPFFTTKAAGTASAWRSAAPSCAPTRAPVAHSQRWLRVRFHFTLPCRRR